MSADRSERRRSRSSLGSRLILTHVSVAALAVAVVAVVAFLLTTQAADRYVSSLERVEGRAGFVPPGLALRQLPETADLRYQIALAAVLGAAVAAVAGVGLAAIVGRRVARPVRASAAVAARVAAGDRRVTLPPSGIPELDDLSAALERLAADLARTERERDQILDDVTHELRTPLAVLRGHVEGVRDGVMEADPATVRRLLAEIDRLERLVDDLRASREVAAGDLVRDPVRPGALLEDARAAHVRAAEAVGVTIELEDTWGTRPVHLDRARIRQVLDNLLTNAIAHAPVDTPVLLVSRAGADGQLLLEVHDRGPGIPPEQQPLIFDRLYRADPSRDRRTGGAGIGLAIVRRLVEAHGGRISVESPPGGGATFRVELPSGSPPGAHGSLTTS